MYIKGVGSAAHPCDSLPAARFAPLNQEAADQTVAFYCRGTQRPLCRSSVKENIEIDAVVPQTNFVAATLGERDYNVTFLLTQVESHSVLPPTQEKEPRKTVPVEHSMIY